MTDNSSITTPILFLIFKRFDTTQRVFEAIKKAKPKKLYIAADGGREKFPEEIVQCNKLREHITQQIDWDCELTTLFRDKNLGGKEAISSAIHWFFSHEETGIILEDDCLPTPSFFSFCQEMLARYQKDTRVMHISGSNLQFGKKYGDGSYYFSKHANIWGWATWRRAWQMYDMKMENFPQFERGEYIKAITPIRQKKYLSRLANVHYRQGSHEWDYPWAYTIYSNNGLVITPNVNLISNIGFGGEAETTMNQKSPLANIPLENISEIVHPTIFLPNPKADENFLRLITNRPSILEQLEKFFKKLFS